MLMGMETQVHETGIMGRQPVVSRTREIIELDDVSRFIGELRGCVDPFALASWVVEEAEKLTPSTTLDEVFEEKPEFDPGIILSVLAYSYTTGVFSSEEIVRNCRTNAAFGALASGKFLFRQELTRFRRRHRTLLMELVARVFVRAVSERFGLSAHEIAPFLDSCLRRVAIERLDIARHLDAADEC
jgi:predicted Zn-dependent protease with MMP-like domain